MSFIHFGCWNKNFCDPNDKHKNGLSQVINSLLTQEKRIPSFYIINGDNYYPSKSIETGNKQKYFNKTNFVSGFNCIQKLQEIAPIYMLMGNHDLEYEKNMFDSQNINNKVNPCTIINQERIFNGPNDFLNFDRYHITIENTIIFFINSIIYTNDLYDKNDIVNIECLKQYRYLEKEYLITLDNIINYDEDIIMLIIKYYKDKDLLKYFKNIVVCGHHPIVSRRDKYNDDGKKKSIKRPLNNKGLVFLNKLYDEFPNFEKFYLCADVHQYQKGAVILGNNTITQYVVGTGGTDCDEECVPFPEPPITEFDKVNKLEKTTSILKSFQLLDCIRSHGYQYCYIDKFGNLLCEFISTGSCFPNAPPTPDKGGYRKKQKTKKNKKTKTKKRQKPKY